MDRHLALRASTTVAYRPYTAFTYYILWLSSTHSAKCAVLTHYAPVVLGRIAGVPSSSWPAPGPSPGTGSGPAPGMPTGQRLRVPTCLRFAVANTRLAVSEPRNSR